MTEDESTQLALMQQKLDDFMTTTRPILEALQGPKGWFASMEARMCAQETQTRNIFAIFSAIWAVAIIIIGTLVANFSSTITTIEHTIALKP